MGDEDRFRSFGGRFRRRVSSAAADNYGNTPAQSGAFRLRLTDSWRERYDCRWDVVSIFGGAAPKGVEKRVERRGRDGSYGRRALGGPRTMTSPTARYDIGGINIGKRRSPMIRVGGTGYRNDRTTIL